MEVFHDFQAFVCYHNSSMFVLSAKVNHDPGSPEAVTNLAINKMWNFFIFLKNNILLYIILATSLNFIWIIVIENLQNHLIWKEKKIKWFQVLVKISTRNLKKGWCQFQWKMSKLCVVLVHWILCLESLAWCARWAWVNQCVNMKHFFHSIMSNSNHTS